MRDVENFPNIHDQRPCHWPTNSPSNYNLLKEWKQRDLFRKLTSHPDFDNQKYEAFLQEAMICKEIHAHVLPRNFTKDRDGQDRCLEHLAYVTKLHDDLASLLPRALNSAIFCLRPQNLCNDMPDIQQELASFQYFEPAVRRRFFELVEDAWSPI